MAWNTTRATDWLSWRLHRVGLLPFVFSCCGRSWSAFLADRLGLPCSTTTSRRIPPRLLSSLLSNDSSIVIKFLCVGDAARHRVTLGPGHQHHQRCKTGRRGKWASTDHLARNWNNNPLDSGLPAKVPLSMVRLRPWCTWSPPASVAPRPVHGVKSPLGMMRGSVWLESKVAAGSTFYVALLSGVAGSPESAE